MICWKSRFGKPLRIAVTAILALPLTANAQSAAVLDSANGAVVIPRVMDAMRSDPRDRLALPPRAPGGRSTSSVAGPWMTAGVAEAKKSIRLALASVAGRRPSAVVLPTAATVSWRWTSTTQLARIAADPRSRALSAAIGVRDMRGVAGSSSAKRQADRLAVTMFARAAADATIAEVRSAFGDVPIVVAEVPAGMATAEVVAAVLAGRARTIPLPGLRLDETARMVASCAAFRQGKRAIEAVQQSDPPPPTASVESRSIWSKGRDGWSGSLLSGAALATSWQPGSRALHEDNLERCLPSASAEPVAGGLRVTLVYENLGTTPLELASIALPRLNLGPSITIQDTRYIGGEVNLSSNLPIWHGTYPGILYVPAVVVRNETIAVGMSVEYPVLEYRHDIRLRCRLGTDGWWGFELGMENSSAHCGFSLLRYPPMIKPSERRQYVVNIVTAAPDRWLSTLESYAKHFKSRFGSVTYQRDMRPIAGFALSQYESQTAANPRGWCHGISEAEGFASAARQIEQRFQICSDRVMLWAPTGYSPNPRANYPFQFASRWSNLIDGAPNPMREAPSMLRSLAAVQGRTLGLWWGHSANPTSNWNEDPTRRLRKDDHAACELWFAELDNAVASGASEIGLDAFVHHITPAWEQWDLIAEARRRYPGVRFCIEERCSDFLHVQAATWVDGYRSEALPGLGLSMIEGPFALANLVVPGHETWVGLQFNRSRVAELWGPQSKFSSQQADVDRVASYGYVPATWVPMPLRQAFSLAR